VLFYLFVLQPRPFVSLAVVGLLVAMTFVPVLYVHPFRVRRFRLLSALVLLVWAGAAVSALVYPFPSPVWVQALLVAAAAYFAGVGLLRSLGQEGAG
jgi:phosphatidylcholine synthase